jgi:hypothetical protein
MNFFEQELRKLTGLCTGLQNPVFAGRSCYGDLGGDNRVKLQFVTLGHADHYEALKATVLNRAEGEVDTLLFRFDDMWGKKQVSNPNFREGVIPYIWTSDRESDWYVYRPTDADFRQLAQAVSAYIGVFADRSLASEKTRTDEKESVIGRIREAKKNPAPRKAPAEKPGAKKRGAEL